MRSRRFLVSTLLVSALVAGLGAQKPAAPARSAAGGVNSITPAELKDWLSYIASDELQGRQIFTEGLGLAGAYIADHLKEWGVKPAGAGPTPGGATMRAISARGRVPDKGDRRCKAS